MGLLVIPEVCEFSADGRNGKIVIESDLKEGPAAIEELRGPVTRQVAIKHAAALGMIAGISNVPRTYPVNEDGKELEFIDRRPIHRYRTDVEVTRQIA